MVANYDRCYSGFATSSFVSKPIFTSRFRGFNTLILDHSWLFLRRQVSSSALAHECFSVLMASSMLQSTGYSYYLYSYYLKEFSL